MSGSEAKEVEQPHSVRSEQAAELNRRQIWRERQIPLERHSLYRKIDQIILGQAPGRVLEIGCDEGRYLEVLRERGWSVAGIELQPQPLEFIVQHDASQPFPFNREFDVVIAAEVIEHIVDTDRFIANCHDVLKADGVLLLTTPNLLFWVNRVLMLFGRRPRFAYADYHVRMFVWDDLAEKIESRFTIRRLRGSHILAGMRHGRAFAIFAYIGDQFPRLSAHFIVEAIPKGSARG